MSGHFPFFSQKKNVSTLNRSLLYIETFSISGRRRTSHRPVMAAHSKRTVSAPIEETRKLAAENKNKKKKHKKRVTSGRERLTFNLRPFSLESFIHCKALRSPFVSRCRESLPIGRLLPFPVTKLSFTGQFIRPN